jgi:hypothetical protein
MRGNKASASSSENAKDEVTSNGFKIKYSEITGRHCTVLVNWPQRSHIKMTNSMRWTHDSQMRNSLCRDLEKGGRTRVFLLEALAHWQ